MSIISQHYFHSLSTGLANRLWTYTATFSSMDGKKLADVYQKLKAQKHPPDEGLPPPSHRRGVQGPGQAHPPSSSHRGLELAAAGGGDFRRPEREDHGGRGRPSSRDRPRVHSPNILRVERPPSRELLMAEGGRPPSRDRLPLEGGGPTRPEYYPLEREIPVRAPPPYLPDAQFMERPGRVAPPLYAAERVRYPAHVRGDIVYDVSRDYAGEAPVPRHRVSPTLLPEMAPVGRGLVPEIELPLAAQEAYRWRERGPQEPGYGGLAGGDVPADGPAWRGGEFETGPRWVGHERGARRWREEQETVHSLPPEVRWGRMDAAYGGREKEVWQHDHAVREEWNRAAMTGRGFGRGLDPRDRQSPRTLRDGLCEPPWSGSARAVRSAGAYDEEVPSRRWDAVAPGLSVDKKVIVEERTDGHVPHPPI